MAMSCPPRSGSGPGSVNASSSIQHAYPKYIKTCPTVHLAFDTLEARNLPVHRPRAPRLTQRRSNCCFLPPHANGEVRKLACCRTGAALEPRLELLHLTASHHPLQILGQI